MADVTDAAPAPSEQALPPSDPPADDPSATWASEPDGSDAPSSEPPAPEPEPPPVHRRVRDRGLLDVDPATLDTGFPPAGRRRGADDVGPEGGEPPEGDEAVPVASAAEVSDDATEVSDGAAIPGGAEGPPPPRPEAVDDRAGGPPAAEDDPWGDGGTEVEEGGLDPAPVGAPSGAALLVPGDEGAVPAPEVVEPVVPGPDPDPVPDPVDLDPVDLDDEEGPFEGPAGGRRRRLTLRSVAFGVILTVLVAAIPVLGVIGAQRLGDSRGGNLMRGQRDPDEAGFLANVEPTLTALVVHRSDDGTPAGATLFAVGAGEIGGTVLQVPLTSGVREPKYFITKLGQSYELGDIDVFFQEVQDLLGVAIQERVDLTDGQMAELFRPVAPLRITSPDEVVLDDGRVLGSGEIDLAAEDVGPFLRASSEGESELARLARTEGVWAAWLAALGAAGEGAVVGGTSLTPLLTALAEGTTQDPVSTRVETLNVALPAAADEDEPPLVPSEGFDAQIIRAVPFPQSPGAGRRHSLKLLNGVTGEPLPRPILHELVIGGASLVQLGNADLFGQEVTTIEIANPSLQPAAEVALFIMGGNGEITTMPGVQGDDADVDMVITIGRDVLAYFEERDDG